MPKLHGARIHITGVVQGVGFRPFVYGLATRLALTGWVRNTSAGVDIEVDGPPETLAAFVTTLREQAPPLARVDGVEVQHRAPNGFPAFEIVHSEAVPDAFQPISPDVSICPDCLREMRDPADRRYRYPFINCTNCGPRFTIIQDIPYDRPKTTMAPFEMCPFCAREYHDPLDRRFHAQPVACPACGPQVWLVIGELVIGNSLPITNYQLPVTQIGEEAIQETRRLLADGQVVAVKGLGGFHLACDATNAAAVAELRRRKGRVDKPFALMMADLATIEKHCFVNTAERELLESRERPIVILSRRPDSNVSPLVTPNQNTLGVMLPYTPLHYLLFLTPSPVTSHQLSVTNHQSPISGLQSPISNPQSPISALVMTSGNFSEEPIATDNHEALTRLAPLADAFLLHNRDIHIRTDDSVVRIFPQLPVISEQSSVNSEQSSVNSEQSETPNYQSPISNLQPPTSNPQSPISNIQYPIRRSRGYAPFPVHLPFDAPPILAVGAELKNTFCVTRERYAFLSHHIGDMENLETLQSFERGVAHFESLFRITPEIIAYDLHPDYMATRYAQARAEREDLPSVGVQHHHAHIAACMAENGLPGDQPVIGVSFDGTGYGSDGAIWGGEFLIADYRDFERAAHLAYVPLPGGDAAIRKPYRMALAWLAQAGLEWTDDLPPVDHASRITHHVSFSLDVLRRQLDTGLNSPPTSSIGRLFDAVSALIGVRSEVNYEGQAAIELEALVDGAERGEYRFEIRREAEDVVRSAYCVDAGAVIRAVVADFRAGVPNPVIAARFHNSVAAMIRDVCVLLGEGHKPGHKALQEVALSGGVFQNMTLLARALDLLRAAGFTVHVHREVPPNDGGIALGQAVVAGAVDSEQ